MKRILVRMSALGVVLVLGGIAIASAQRHGDQAEAAFSDPPAFDSQRPAPARAEADPPGLPERPAAIAALPAGVRRANYETSEPPAITPIAQTSDPAAGAPDPFGLGTASADEGPRAAAALVGSEPAAPPRTTPPSPPAEHPTIPRISPIAAPAESDGAASHSDPRSLDGEDASGAAPTGSPSRLAPLAEPHSLEAAGDLRAPAQVAPPAEARPMLASPGPALGGQDAPSDAAPRLLSPGRSTELAEPTEVASPADGTGRPSADKELEGVQTPQLNIQKTAPKEIQVGKPAEFLVTVKNFGRTPAVGVEVRDQVPQGTRLIDTAPRASRGARGELVWSLGKIDPGKEVTVQMRVMPTAEGEIGSVATVYFQADASARTTATKPQLVVETSAPRQVMIDEAITLSITVSNPGTGTATGVVLQEHVPPGFQHEAGAELEYEVGELKPKESRELKLKLTAVRPGPVANVLIARGEGLPEVKKELPLEVIAPELKIALDGPKSRFLRREATYRVSVSNPGTAPARDVKLEAVLPAGLQFVGANNNGQFDPNTRTVRWALAELPVNETGMVELTAMPVEIGRQTLSLRGSAQKALEVSQQQEVVVDGIAAIRFEVVDLQDPIEVGSETTYEIRVLNQGSKDAQGVQVTVVLPAGLQPVAAEGPDSLAHSLQGNQIVFAPLSRLSPKVESIFRVRVQGSQPGDQRIRVQLQTAQMQTPVTKEESTRVFSDR